MSWDVYIMRAEGIDRVENIPDNFRPESLGVADAVRKKISECVPSIDWSDPTWGDLEEDGFSWEVSLPLNGEVDGFMIFVRGGGDPITPIARVCKLNGWRAIADGEFLDFSAPSSDGYTDWQSFRDRCFGQRDDSASSDP